MPFNLHIYNQETIVSLSEQEKTILRTLDIYYQPEYLICDEAIQGGKYELAIAISGNDYWVYPYIVIPIKNTPYFDLISPYGYGGPTTNNLEFGKKAELFFVEEIRKRKNVITELVRYHYLYNQSSLFEQDIQNIHNRNVVVLHTDTDEDLWISQFSGTTRNLVRKLEKEGYEWREKVFEKADIADFKLSYYANMKHTNAADFYFFDDSFFQQLVDQLGDKIHIAYVEKEGIVFASALFFISGGIVSYYLSARNLDYPKVPGSNLLLSKMSLWAQDNHLKLVNFGGGLSLSEADFLFKFKRNFSKDTLKFYIGKRIHQPAIYEELKEKYIQEKGMEAYEKVKHLLQFYY